MKKLFNKLFGRNYELTGVYARVDSSNWKLRVVGDLIIKESPCKGIREIVGFDAKYELDDSLISKQFFTKEAADKYLPLNLVDKLAKTKRPKSILKIGYLEGCNVRGFGLLAVSWAKTSDSFWPSQHLGDFKGAISFFAHSPAGVDKRWLFYPVMLLKAS